MSISPLNVIVCVQDECFLLLGKLSLLKLHHTGILICQTNLQTKFVPSTSLEKNGNMSRQ